MKLQILPMSLILVTLGLTLGTAGITSGANDTSTEYYVAPSGSDSNPGSFDQPFQSITRAQAQVRKSASLKKQPITVYLKEGTYYLNDPIVFSNEDSGSPDAPVTYAAVESGNVIISGGLKLELNWKPYRDGIQQAAIPDDMVSDYNINGGKTSEVYILKIKDSE